MAGGDARHDPDPTADLAPSAEGRPGAASARAAAHEPAVGETIGRFRLLQRLGEGGFGVVYLAEQQEPVQRRVALKLLRRGVQTAQVIARFEAERQALALMDHPHIARVYDAGTDGEGRPFFAMEFVSGERLTDFAQRHGLDLRARLELLRQVCSAIDHAHKKAIIHRDIKPANVIVSMVDGRPFAKVIDFGIAKALSAPLTERTIVTEHRQMIGTIEYMSPEQAEGALDVDTRSDVYALGVLLYELLCGATPFDGERLRSAPWGEMLRIIREVEPPLPSRRLADATRGAASERAGSGRSSSMRRDRSGTGFGEASRTWMERTPSAVRGELDWIAMKALEKDPHRRYQSAGELGDDLGRFLDGDAVFAAPLSTSYRLRKFVRRHRVPVVLGGVIAATLVIGLVGTSTGFFLAARRADGERQATAAAEEAARISREATMAAERAAEDARRERDAAEEARRTIERNAYIANVQMAGAAREAGRDDLARARLDACPEPLRGWEWRWLDAETDRSLLRLHGHDGAVRCIAWSPDGTRVLTGSADGTARLWDAAAGTEILRTREDDGGILSVDFAPDGRRFVTSAADGGARVRDAVTGETLARLTGHHAVPLEAFFSPDGTRVATASWDGSARIFDAASGAKLALLAGHARSIEDAAFNHDGTVLATGSRDGTAILWRTADGGAIATLACGGAVQSLAFSPDGTRLVTCAAGGPARLWDGRTGERVLDLQCAPGIVRSAAFSPDGARLATAGSNGIAVLWDARSGEPIHELEGHDDAINAVRFSPDGSQLATASRDMSIRLWGVEDGTLRGVLVGHVASVADAVFSADGTRLASVALDRVRADGSRVIADDRDRVPRLWDAHPPAAQGSLSGHGEAVRDLAFGADGTTIVSIGIAGDVRRWDLETEAAIASSPRGHPNAPTALSRDGRLAAVGMPGFVRIVEVERGAVLRDLPTTSGRPAHLGFSGDGSTLVLVPDQGAIEFWDVDRGALRGTVRGAATGGIAVQLDARGNRLVLGTILRQAAIVDARSGEILHRLKGHDGMVARVALSPDERVAVTAANDGAVRIWSMERGALLGEHHGAVLPASAIAVAPDGRSLLAAFASEPPVILRVPDGAVIARLEGQRGVVAAAAFSPDGSRVVTAGDEGLATVWDAATGAALAELRGHGRLVNAVAWSADGRTIATASADGTVRLWRDQPARERREALRRFEAQRAAMAPRVESAMARDPEPATLRMQFLRDTTLTDEARRAALAEVQQRVDERAWALLATADEVGRLNAAAWEVVRDPGAEAPALEQALADARRAAELAPESGLVLNTLGAALVRAGRNDEALSVLARSESINAASLSGPEPADWAFIAMAQWRVGDRDAAIAAQQRLRHLAGSKVWADPLQLERWLAELEALMGPAPEGPPGGEERRLRGSRRVGGPPVLVPIEGGPPPRRGPADRSGRTQPPR